MPRQHAFGPETPWEDIFIALHDTAEETVIRTSGVEWPFGDINAIESQKSLQFELEGDKGKLSTDEVVSWWLNGRKIVEKGEDSEEGVQTAAVVYEIGFRIETPASPIEFPREYLKLLLEMCIDDDPDILDGIVEDYEVGGDVDVIGTGEELEAMGDKQALKACLVYMEKYKSDLWTFEEIEYVLHESTFAMDVIRRFGFKTNDESVVVAEHDSSEQSTPQEVVHSPESDGNAIEKKPELSIAEGEQPDLERMPNDVPKILLHDRFREIVTTMFGIESYVDAPSYVHAQGVLAFLGNIGKPFLTEDQGPPARYKPWVEWKSPWSVFSRKLREFRFRKKDSADVIGNRRG
jgi:hypothetical protein